MSQSPEDWTSTFDDPDDAVKVCWLAEGRLARSAAIPVEGVETLGAGDVFQGAFSLVLAEGHANAEAIQFALAVAALKCSRGGGRESYPTQAEVLHLWIAIAH